MKPFKITANWIGARRAVMGLQSSYFIAGNYFCIMWESWIGKKNKEFKYQTERKGRHKERVAKQEKTQPLNQTLNEKNECLPHQKSYCCFWLFGSDHQESFFFFFYVKVKTNIQTMFPGVTSSPSQLLLLHLSSFLIGAGLYKHCLKHRLLDFKQTHASHLHLPADVTALPLADVTFF